MEQFPTTYRHQWYDDAQTILQVDVPAESTAEQVLQTLEAVRDRLDTALSGVAVVTDLSSVRPPADIVGQFSTIFQHPLLKHPHLEMIVVIVAGNRPMQVLTTVFRRLYALFGDIPFHIVDSLDEAMETIAQGRADN